MKTALLCGITFALGVIVATSYQDQSVSSCADLLEKNEYAVIEKYDEPVMPPLPLGGAEEGSSTQPLPQIVW